MCGCQGTGSCKIPSCVQRFMSYLANRDKNSDENNTVRRYCANSNKHRTMQLYGYV